ncbi:MAG: transposase, partial [Clostridiales bacterium]|nr:transposase [Clostridiales bacterium]
MRIAEIKSGRHSRYLILYHMVWIPKYRRTVLGGPIADRLKEIIQETAKER